jgi:hypothetical protein
LSRARRFTTGPLAVWGLTLAAVVAFAPSATAGCGAEHVHYGHRQPDPTTPATSADPTPAPATPCNGPSCSSRPIAPPAPVTTTAPTVDRTVQFPTAPAGDPAPGAWRAGSDDPSPPLQRPAAVYRPPR